jgi:hypothetical protein
VQVCGFRLLIHDAEEATLAWQEAQQLLFPEADVARVLEGHAARLVAQLRARRAAVPWACSADGRSLQGVVDLDGFLRLLRALGTPPFDSLAGLTMHEAVALFRAFRAPARPLLELGLLEAALVRSAGMRPNAV